MLACDHLLKARENLKAIEKIMKDADPASGVSFCVRRGVYRDDENNPMEDQHRRPFTIVELSDLTLASAALESIRSGVLKQVDFWTRASREDIRKSQEALDQA